MKPATFNAYLDKIQTLKDKSVKLSFVTQEMNAEDSTTLFGLRDQLGWLLFSPTEIKGEDIPQEPSHNFDDKKSPSERLRGAIFVYWKQKVGTGSFDLYYYQQMEKLKAMYLEQLTPIHNSREENF